MHLGPELLLQITNPDGDEGNGLLSLPTHFPLEAQDALNKPVLSPAYGMRIISPLRENHDKFFLFQELFQQAKRVQGFYWISSIERNRSQGG